MTTADTTRRNLLHAAAAGAAAATALLATAERAFAYQGNMERALAELRTALRSLREATPDKGGHKATAIGLIEQAMSEIQAGINYAAEKFGD